MGKTIHFKITPVWTVIGQIRRQIQAKLADAVDQKTVDAAVICAVELAQNAVKYGEAVPNLPYIHFQLDFEGNEIGISVANGVLNPSDIEILKNTIDSINRSRSAKRLYVNRLNEIIDKGFVDKSQLGLFRIAHETKFNLSYIFDNNVITIKAIRKVR